MRCIISEMLKMFTTGYLRITKIWLIKILFLTISEELVISYRISNLKELDYYKEPP